MRYHLNNLLDGLEGLQGSDPKSAEKDEVKDLDKVIAGLVVYRAKIDAPKKAPTIRSNDNRVRQLFKDLLDQARLEESATEAGMKRVKELLDTSPKELRKPLARYIKTRGKDLVKTVMFRAFRNDVFLEKE
jgi:hypothetical protein